MERLIYGIFVSIFLAAIFIGFCCFIWLIWDPNDFTLKILGTAVVLGIVSGVLTEMLGDSIYNP